VNTGCELRGAVHKEHSHVGIRIRYQEFRRRSTRRRAHSSMASLGAAKARSSGPITSLSGNKLLGKNSIPPGLRPDLSPPGAGYNPELHTNRTEFPPSILLREMGGADLPDGGDKSNCCQRRQARRFRVLAASCPCAGPGAARTLPAVHARAPSARYGEARRFAAVERRLRGHRGRGRRQRACPVLQKGLHVGR
jgi:hypothetical protein